ncbi:hypothetical protein, conserved [Entamoeba dispar SAW760]|uniref:Leucine rich repeat containing protein BspA family protein n=2 Tax=Entamoeba dispar TaxID=46681 RepID=B0ETN8_ENTDS|nr:uncharacterized protein EDI_330470 [Entamoeba dispar SAW760]ABF18965.1 putative BspA-like leucine-rich repeat protein [Entamoeba dispar]EDR22111.1 hypothetical protein, conserved [Entamoeba dispar SAW760]|eukprot:EDR22111.1 hypothetical protein, conserved [Entamoeba dispar SAW760]
MKLGYNEIMIVSMYFNDINDFINLEMGVKRYRGNMERFHFNPIPLNKYSRKFFPNIETFHIYNEDDKIFNDGRIFKKVIWYFVEYSTYLKKKKKGNIYKNIEYTESDRKSYGTTIPTEVKSLGDNCFEYCNELTSINIPSSISKIGYHCFEECTSLTSMNIDNLQFISKERIFMNEPVLISFEIPENLKIINGKNICKKDINEFIIPSSITKIGDWCFSYFLSLKSTNIPSSINEIGDNCFLGCSSLKSINIPSSITSFGGGCFYECSSLTSINIDNLQFISEKRIFMNEPVLVSTEIPENLEIINGKNIENKDINEFIIPSSITKLDDGCFYECESLKSITIPSSISEIGNNCFYECELLKSINIPSSITSFGYGCFYGCGCVEELMKNKTIPRNCFDEWY